MKHVWMLNHYAQEPSGAGGTRHYSLARHLLAHGWSTTVVAGSVELNTGRQRLSDGDCVQLCDFDGVHFLWVRTPQYEGNGAKRILNMLAYTYRVLRPEVTQGLQRPNVVVGSSVHPFAAWSAAVLARRFRVPFIFEVRDLWPQSLVDLGRLRPYSVTTRSLRVLEKWLYQRAARIIVLLPNASDYIVPLGFPAEKIAWVPNGVDLDGYPEPLPPKERESFTLMYLGAHGNLNGLDCLIRAMAELKNMPSSKPIHLRMIGDGPLKPALKELARNLRLDNIQFCDPVPKREIPPLAAEADAFVLCVRNLPNLYRFGISMNKLFDYFAAARPIIIGSAASNNPVEDANAGITVKPEDPVALAEAIAALAAMPCAQRAAMGHSGRAYVERNNGFNYLAARFGSLLDDVLAEYR